MMKVNANRKVLLTGASAYLGSHVLDVFLRAGYIVKATVRNQKKVDQVAARYSIFLFFTFLILTHHSGSHNTKIDLKPTVFNRLVKGTFTFILFSHSTSHIISRGFQISGIIHTASPFKFQVTGNKKDLAPSLSSNLLRNIRV
jgi:nucleoside-diphosphate-sugar epimerase